MDRDTFEKMQQAAERRVMEQKRKENSYKSGNLNNEKTDIPQSSMQTSAPKSTTPAVAGVKNQSKEFLGLLNLKNIAIDSDRALIMGIILLLASEEADEWLILALIYIML